MKKLVLSLMMIVAFTISSNAQSDKVKAKINKKIEKIDQSITASDKSAALTPKQKEKIFVLLLDLHKRTKKIKKGNKEAANLKDLIKAENKKVNKIIFKEVLTKKQRTARKMTMQKKKEAKKNAKGKF